MNTQVRKIMENRYVVNVIYALMALMALIPIVGSVIKSGVDCDSAYYICIGERITEGYVPYHNLYVTYTPLWFYIEAVFKIIFHIPNGIYWPYLILFYVFQISGAYFLYRIIRCLDIKKSIALFAGWLYLIMSHWLHGYAVLLEVPSVTFCVLACWLVVEFKDKGYWHYLWIGCIAACSFLVKQYGLGTLALCIYLMLFVAKCNWRQNLGFVIGYILPGLLCIGIWGDSFLYSVLFNGYGTQAAIEAGYVITLSSKIYNIFRNLNYFCYMICPVIYIGWMFGYMAYCKKRLWHLILAYSGILGYSLVFFFTEELHYYQYLLPFAIILIAELLQSIKDSEWKYIIYIMTAWILFVSSYKTFKNRAYKVYFKGEQKEYLEKLSTAIAQQIPRGETAFVIGNELYYVYFSADILPPNLTTIGYSFGPMGLNQQKTWEQIHRADWIVRYASVNPYSSYYTEDMEKYIERTPTLYLCDSVVLLNKMH